MCSSVRPDFNAEEMASVAKNQRELNIIVEDMADHLPIEDPTKGEELQGGINYKQNAVTFELLCWILACCCCY